VLKCVLNFKFLKLRCNPVMALPEKKRRKTRCRICARGRPGV